MILPQSNATLTAVHGGTGETEDFGTPANAGATKWQGRVGVYLRERSERVETANDTSIVISRALIVPGDLQVPWAQADTLTVQRAGQTDTLTVRDIERRDVTGVELTTVRLVLEDQ